MKSAVELLEDLGKLGYAEKTVEVTKDIKVTLKTLTATEEADVFGSLKGLEGIQFFNKNKIHTLARSIVKINDIDFNIDPKIKKIEAPEDMDEQTKEKLISESLENKKQEITDKKVEIISSWSGTIIDELYKVFSELVEIEEKRYQFIKDKK